MLGFLLIDETWAESTQDKKEQHLSNSEMVRTLTALAEIGDLDAEYELGVIYSLGLGMPQDMAAATASFRKAADGGHGDARRSLTVITAPPTKTARPRATCPKSPGQISTISAKEIDPVDYEEGGGNDFWSRLRLSHIFRQIGCPSDALHIWREVLWAASSAGRDYLNKHDIYEELRMAFTSVGQSKEAALALIAAEEAENHIGINVIPPTATKRMISYGYSFNAFLLNQKAPGAAWAFRSMYYAKTGRADLARRALVKATAMSKNAYEFYRIGFSYHELNDVPAAIRAYEVALEKLPSVPASDVHREETNSVVSFLFDLYGKTNHAEKLNMKALEAYVQRDPLNDRAVALLSNLYLAAGRSEDAKRLLQKAATDPSSSPQIHLDLGVQYQQDGQLDKAIQEYRLAMGADDRNGAVEMAWHAPVSAHKAAINLARIYSEKGDAGNAIRIYKAAITSLESSSSKPDNLIVADLYAGLGLARAQQGNLREAVSNLEDAVQLNDRDGNTHLNLGWAHYLSGNTPQAIEHLKKAVELFKAQNDGNNLTLTRDRLKAAQARAETTPR